MKTHWVRATVGALAVMACMPWQATAQWTTQSIGLVKGWNAVFLHVDASHATLDQLVGPGAVQATPIAQVWSWTPNSSSAQFITSPQQPIVGGSQWARWTRGDAAQSSLSILTPNFAYLVYSTNAFTWNLKGRPVLPRQEWSVSGLNLVGFPMLPGVTNSFETFLASAPSLLDGDIFRYAGGEFGPTNPGKVFALRTEPVRRGQAYWIRSADAYPRFYGPFEVVAAGDGMVNFGTTLAAAGFRLRNLSPAPLTVSLNWTHSESAPVGQPVVAGTPPLLLRGNRNITNLTYEVSSLDVNSPRSWTLAPAGEQGSEAEVVLGLDRSAITNPVGSVLAGVLQFADSLGQTRVDVGVSASPASSAGLWVGSAVVTQVGQYLQTYQRDASDNPVVQPDGSYAVSGVVTNLTPVPKSFPLRLIVHNPASGPATLWQRIFQGLNASNNPVVANQESVLSESQLASARRISASQLPWSEQNPGWSFNGPLGMNATVTVTVTNRFDQHESNPFLHTYHPDHDNLNARFSQEVPQGSESYTITREITLRTAPPAMDFNARVGAGSTLGGYYLETVRVFGLARGGGATDVRRFDVLGVFSLNRISEIPTLTRAP